MQILRIITGVIILLTYSSLVIAQTCNIESIPSSANSIYFIENGDGTVTDKRTGLMWKKCSEGQTGFDCDGDSKTYRWREALNQAQIVNSGDGFAGYKDWRVPNVNELASIIEEQCCFPAINLGVFPNTPSLLYWSSTPVTYAEELIMVVDMARGDRGQEGFFNGAQLRLVRSNK